MQRLLFRSFPRARFVMFFVGSLSVFVVAFALAADENETVTPDGLPTALSRNVDFVKDVQPLFRQNCYQCHGPKKHEAGLRLDRREDALAGGDSGSVIEVGKSDESPLILHVAGVETFSVMPPKGDRLTKAEIGLLRGWIDQGAKWPASADDVGKRSDHWAFQPITQPEIPSVKQRERVRNPIDAFVLAKLEAERVLPSPEADRPTLIRRLSLDLLGLPPTPEEVDEFVNDKRADAYELLVDRLLSSPHFGERWGRHWLDLARYADSDGYEKDLARPHAWRYRDWVIQAINDDLPFDIFTRDQLAGDLLPDATLAQKMATGFHRNTLTNREGGVDQEEFRIAATVDRLNTTGAIWLGLTVGCAQCHTHKYDPITQREYYQMFAFFNAMREVDVPALTPEAQATYDAAKAKFDAEHAPLAAALKEYEQQKLPARQAAWEPTFRPPVWTVLTDATITGPDGVTFTKQEDGSYLVGGENPETATYTVRIKMPVHGITGIRLEVLPDDKLPAKGPGRVAHGNFVLSEFQVATTGSDGELHVVPLQNPTADFEQGTAASASFWPIVATLDGDEKTGWAISNQFGKPHSAVFETKENLGVPDSETPLTFTLIQNYGTQHTIGRFRLAVTTTERPVRLQTVGDELPMLLAIPAAERNDAQKKAIADYFRTVDPEFLKRKKTVDDHAQQAPNAPNMLAQTVAAQPRETHMLIRGDFLRKGDATDPGTLSVLNPLQTDEDAPDRLDFVAWLVDPANPLTRRVTVNRWWRHLFGKALVTTVDDFGLRGENPSHPALLDWLAQELLSRKWSRKSLIKLMVTSSTYRQSSKHREELAERDPKNVWLARQNRYRLEAEIVRDLYLSASGLLTDQTGGPSVRPPLPPGVAELGYAGSVKWATSTGPDKYRRGMYIFFQRTVPYPMLTTFDAPDSNTACLRRERSNTPLQALTLLNDPVFVECAQALGRRVVLDDTEPAARIRRAFRLCLGREPQPEEVARLQALYDDLIELASADPESAAKLAGPDLPKEANPVEAAAAVALGRIILNLDEFLVRE